MRIAVLAVLLVSAAIAVAGQSSSDSKLQAQLKQLFPSATGFSAKEGQPPHFKAYSGGQTVAGYAFWTTDFVPQEHGYHGPIHILVGLNLTGNLTGVVVDYDSEPYGYFSVEPPKFAEQFKGKSIRDQFRVGADVDAVSRASISIASAARAIRDSSRMAAKIFTPDAVK